MRSRLFIVVSERFLGFLFLLTPISGSDGSDKAADFDFLALETRGRQPHPIAGRMSITKQQAVNALWL